MCYLSGNAFKERSGISLKGKPITVAHESYYIKIHSGTDYMYLECTKGIDHFLDLILVLKQRGVKYKVITKEEFVKQPSKLSSSKFFSKFEKLL